MSRQFIITLTSIPPRFGGIGPVLQSLVNQGADGVELWIPDRYDRFPDWDGSLPDAIEGVSIRRCANDFGPATKFLPACEIKGRILLMCDDDCIYRPGWADAFRQVENKETCLAASSFSVQRLGVNGDGMIAQGFAGIRIQSEWLDGRTITNRDRFADDIWLSAQLAWRGIAIQSIPQARAYVEPLDAPNPLQHANFEGRSRGDTYHKSAQSLARELRIWGH